MTTPRPSLVLAILITGLFMANLDVAIANVAAPAIQQSLQTTGAELQFVVSGYVVSFAMLLTTAARLGAMYGYGRLFFVGATVFTAASLACGLAPNPLVLIVARVVQGGGAAFMVAQVLSGIQLNFAGRERVRAIGTYAIVLSAGAVAGQILGGVLIAANLFGATWRPAFLINVPIGLLLLAVATRALPMHRQAKTSGLDLRGVGVLSVTVLLAIVPLIVGREQHWPLWTWLCLALSVPAGALFVAVERQATARGDEPLVNLEVLRRPRVALGLVASGGALCTYFAMLFVLALYLQAGLGESSLYSGLALVSWVSAFGVSGPLLRRIAPKYVPMVACIGYLVLAGAYLAISASLAAGQFANGALLMILLGFGGLGLGLGRNSTIADLTSSVPDTFAADLSGLINTASQLAGAAGVALFGSLYLSLAPQAGPGQAVPAFTIVCAGFGVLALLTAGAAAAATRTNAAPVRPPEKGGAASPVPGQLVLTDR